MRARKISIVSGHWDPFHVGHLELFQKAKEISDILYVIMNTDGQIYAKTGKVFMPYEEREKIIQAIRYVDSTIFCIDKDHTVCETLRDLARTNQKIDEALGQNTKLIFCNGGDRKKDNIPEYDICNEFGIEMVFGLGGKIQSSSELLKNYAKSQG